MRRREAVLALFAAGFVVLALLTVFAIELSNTQAKSKRDVEARVHERAILGGALIDSLFGSAEQQLPQYRALYGARTVSVRTLDAKRATNLYLVVLDSEARCWRTPRGSRLRPRATLSDPRPWRLFAPAIRTDSVTCSRMVGPA